jgi:4-diphosphocytidyl-2-C-methyl-D-erythritol kinase
LSDILSERAPAKINLTLHVLSRRDDGWHELESLVVFSRSGDLLSLTPGPVLSLTVSGPSAGAAGATDDNLVCKAARHLAARIDGLRLGAFHLEKNLPVAAGIGGGSSDAAAALRLLARANRIDPHDPRLADAARATGADVPVCLAAKGRMMRGFGDKLGPVMQLPPLMSLIVNPRQPVETKHVFARMNITAGTQTGFGGHPDIPVEIGSELLFDLLRRSRNDMEDAACTIAPVIGDVLAILSAAPGCKLARMSGSGATCFALFADCKTAARARKTILSAHPEWWVKVSLLN